MNPDDIFRALEHTCAATIELQFKQFIDSGPERPHRKLTTAPLFGNHSDRRRYTTPIDHPILKSLVLSDF